MVVGTVVVGVGVGTVVVGWWWGGIGTVVVRG